MEFAVIASIDSKESEKNKNLQFNLIIEIFNCILSVENKIKLQLYMFVCVFIWEKEETSNNSAVQNVTA